MVELLRSDVRDGDPEKTGPAAAGILKIERYVDEVFVKLNGQRRYLWRAFDQEGEVLEAIVTKRRKKQAVLKFLKKLMQRHGAAN